MNHSTCRYPANRGGPPQLRDPRATSIEMFANSIFHAHVRGCSKGNIGGEEISKLKTPQLPSQENIRLHQGTCNGANPWSKTHGLKTHYHALPGSASHVNLESLGRVQLSGTHGLN